MFLLRLAQALQSRKISYALVGGYAVSLHGAVRGTVDVDLVIGLSKREFTDFEATVRNIGLEPRLPVTAEQVFDFREEYIANRNLIAWNFFNPGNPVETVDVILTHDVGKMKAVSIDVGGTPLKVASIKDLIRMKETAGRPQDLADVEALKKKLERGRK